MLNVVLKSTANPLPFLAKADKSEVSVINELISYAISSTIDPMVICYIGPFEQSVSKIKKSMRKKNEKTPELDKVADRNRSPTVPRNRKSLNPPKEIGLEQTCLFIRNRRMLIYPNAYLFKNIVRLLIFSVSMLVQDAGHTRKSEWRPKLVGKHL